MNGVDQLLVVVQVSIALVGFAGVVATFEHTDTTKKKTTLGDAIGIAIMVEMGLVNSFFAALPLIIFSLGVAEQTTWRISSGFMCINYVIALSYITKSMRGLKIRRRAPKLMFGFLFILGTATLTIVVLNTLNIFFHGEFEPYYISLILPLYVSGYMFARLVLRPILRNVESREPAEPKSTAKE